MYSSFPFMLNPSIILVWKNPLKIPRWELVHLCQSVSCQWSLFVVSVFHSVCQIPSLCATVFCDHISWLNICLSWRPVLEGCDLNTVMLCVSNPFRHTVEWDHLFGGCANKANENKSKTQSHALLYCCTVCVWFCRCRQERHDRTHAGLSFWISVKKKHINPWPPLRCNSEPTNSYKFRKCITVKTVMNSYWWGENKVNSSYWASGFRLWQDTFQVWGYVLVTLETLGRVVKLWLWSHEWMMTSPACLPVSPCHLDTYWV